MYLLNPIASEIASTVPPVFTFHYVSIKSLALIVGIESKLEFTFHYVSIKSILSV